MTTPTTQALITDYLQRLRVAAEVLAEPRKTELLEEIAEHITAAQEHADVRDGSTQALLARLGDPAEIVAAAREEELSGPPVRLELQHEAVALLLMTAGSALPLIGWALGVARLWSSKRFQLREKVAGSLLFPGGAFGIRYFDPYLRPEGCVTHFGRRTCEGGVSDGLRFGLSLTFLLGSLGVAGLLWLRVRRRAVAASGRAGTNHSTFTLPGTETTAVLLLCLGNFLMPALAPLVGAGVASRSQRWNPSEKRVALAVTTCSAVAFALSLFLLGVSHGTDHHPAWTFFVGMPIAYLGPPLAGLYLQSRLRGRP